MGTNTVPKAADILKDLKGNEVTFDEKRIQFALEVAQEAYKDKVHWSGKSLMEHVLGVLEALMPFQPDEDAIIACLLHHILSSDDWNLIELEQQFDAKIRSLVSGVHLLSHVTVHGRRNSIEDLRLILLTVSDDVRIILISVCEISYLLQYAEALSKEDRRRICRDALQLFAPVSARLGIYSLKTDLESKAFPILYPTDAEHIDEQIDYIHLQHGDFINNSARKLQDYLKKQGISARVMAREKLPYSLFRKMRRKTLSSVDDIYDFYALRVVLNSVEECYQALGLLHKIGRPVAHRFKDFVSFPKPNGYQSLHTTLMQVPGAPENVMVEVQVRTEEMHREAEFGIAAHWSYKSYGSTSLAMEHAQLQQMLSSQEMLDEAEGKRLVDHIFVLSPKGDIIELPEGATPLDFAFQVHTGLGLSFRGARVNGTMVSIDHELENGDIIEILKHKVPKPSPQWFQLLKLSSSRSKLKRYLYEQDRPELIAQGKQLVNEVFKRHRLPRLDQELSALRLCDGNSLSLQQREDLLMKIGQGSEKASALVNRLEVFKDIVARKKYSSPSASPPEISANQKCIVEVEGGLPMPTRFAKCCKAEKKVGLPIIGVISREGVVIVHLESCGMLRNANPSRQVKVNWKR